MNAQVIDVAYASPDYFEHWHGINWRKCHEKVRKMQARIVKATQEGRWRRVKALQWLLTHSRSAKALAVKRVTENKDKKTAGVDGAIWSTQEGGQVKRCVFIDDTAGRYSRH